MSKFLIFKSKRRPIVSISNNEVIRRRFINYLPSTTIKKKIFKNTLTILSYFQLHTLLAIKYNSPIPYKTKINFDAFHQKLRSVFQEDVINYIIMFPSQINRKRVYIYVTNENGDSIGFVKMGFDQYSNTKISNEVIKLNEAAKLRFKTFKLPLIKCTGEFEGNFYAVFEFVENNQNDKIIDWITVSNKVREEINSKNVKLKQLEDFKWWRSFRSFHSDKINYVFRSLNINNQTSIKTCFSHGDFHKGNFIIQSNNIYILDWEDSSFEAPVYTDKLTYFLGTIQREILKNPQKAMSLLEEKYLKDVDDSTKMNVIIALVYLYMNGRGDVKILLDNNWL